MQRTWFALVASGLVACGGLRGVEVIDGPIPGVATVTFKGPSEGTASVEFVDRADGEVVSTSVELPGELVQLGLKAGGNYDVTVSVTDPDGDTAMSDPIAYQAAPPPGEGPTFVQQTFDPDRTCDPEGRFLVSWLGSTTGVAVVDRAGNYRWALPSATDDEQINRTRVSRDGSAFHYLFVDLDRVDDIAEVVTQPLDGNAATRTRVLNGHHDFVELDDGATIGSLGYDFRDVPASEIVDLPSPWQGEDPLPTAADTIYETTIGADGAADVRTVINLYDDYFPEHPITYTIRANFRKDAFLPGYHELTHGNSLALVGETYLAMLRWTDSVVGVDRNTGEFWTLGGVYNEFTPVEGQTTDDLFLQPHFSDAWEDDDGLHMLVFDNRPAGEASRLSEYVLDVTNRTVERVWTYQAPEHEAVLGDVQRINLEGCDNLLVSFSGRGRLVELTRDGDIVWEVATRAGSALARVQYLPDFVTPAAAVYPSE